MVINSCGFLLVSGLKLVLCFYLASDVVDKISQMPIVLIPIHFDRDPIYHIPSCQRSVVIRTFVTSDFMTGVPVTPGKQIPTEVQCCYNFMYAVLQCNTGTGSNSNE